MSAARFGISGRLAAAFQSNPLTPILAIVGLLLACLAFGAVLGIVAIILGIVALRRVKANTGGGKGLAIAGVVTGVIATLLGIGAGIYWGFVWSLAGPCMFETDPAAQQQCINEQVESRFSTAP